MNEGAGLTGRRGDIRANQSPPPSGDCKLVLIKRPTRLEELVVRYNSEMQARFYIERMGGDFGDYVREHETYHNALRLASSLLEGTGRLQLLERKHVSNYLFGDEDIVVALGQDGLVANTLKYLQNQPLIGVNPDPERWDGVLLPFTAGDLRRVVPEVLRGKRDSRRVSLAKAVLNDGQSLYAVNDLFIGRRTHVSARYELKLGGQAERQSSSGIIVSTGLGASGWLKSVLAGASGIMRGARSGAYGEQPLMNERSNLGLEHEAAGGESFGWDANHLYYSVREPFPSRSSGAELVFGRIDEATPLSVVSQMPEDGVIFSDGVESDFLAFNGGLIAEIGIAEKQGRLIC